MQIKGTIIEAAHAEGFRAWAMRLIVTACELYWVDAAVRAATGYATSLIGCDTEAGLEHYLEPSQTPDGRPGAAILFFAFRHDALARAVVNRIGQCLLTCPTAAVFDGLADINLPSEEASRFEIGEPVAFFGDGFQRREMVAGRNCWLVPVMDGQFTIEESAGAIRAVAGGNFLIYGIDSTAALSAARRAVEAIAPLPGVITPFPGGVVRSSSKVGSRYQGQVASTNHPYCPTLRGQVPTKLPPEVGCVYEIVIDGLSYEAVAAAIRAGVRAACGPGVVAISAADYGGKLGKVEFHLHQIMS